MSTEPSACEHEWVPDTSGSEICRHCLRYPHEIKDAAIAALQARVNELLPLLKELSEMEAENPEHVFGGYFGEKVRTFKAKVREALK